MTIEDTVITAFRSMFDEDILPTTTLASLQGDSLDAIEIVMELEEVHDIEIEDELTERIQWLSVKEIAAEIKQKYFAPQPSKRKKKMSKPKKSFVIRGFNVTSESFNEPTGVIKDKPSFKETVVKTQSEAIVSILTDEDFSAATSAATDPKDTLQIVDLKVNLNITDKFDVRAVKSSVREVLKHWAEKSRVKNRRGFRISAIRTPDFEYHANSTDVKVQVILSNTIHYADWKMNDDPQTQTTVLADLGLLKKELTKRLDWKFNGISYNHSLIGKGSL